MKDVGIIFISILLYAANQALLGEISAGMPFCCSPSSPVSERPAKHAQVLEKCREAYLGQLFLDNEYVPILERVGIEISLQVDLVDHQLRMNLDLLKQKDIYFLGDACHLFHKRQVGLQQVGLWRAEVP